MDHGSEKTWLSGSGMTARRCAGTASSLTWAVVASEIFWNRLARASMKCVAIVHAILLAILRVFTRAILCAMLYAICVLFYVISYWTSCVLSYVLSYELDVHAEQSRLG